MSKARDGSLPRREVVRMRSQMPQDVHSTRTANEENIASGSQSTVDMRAKRKVLTSVGMPPRSSSSRVLQQSNSNRSESSRSQRFALCDDDSDEEDSVDELASQLFGSSSRRQGKTSIKVKPEPQRSQSQNKLQRSQSQNRPASSPIDLTFITTDDEAPPLTATQKPKSVSKSSMNSSQSGLDGKKVMKKKKKVDTQAIDKVKLQSMISGGSGKSENDSIVLLDTDEEEGNAVSRPVTSPSVPMKKMPSPYRNGILSQPVAVIPSGSTHLKLDAASSHRSTLAAWRNAAPSSASSRKLTQSDSLSSNASQSIRSTKPIGTVSSQPAPPLLCTQPPTSSPNKKQTEPHTSQTDTSTQEDKRMKAIVPAKDDDQESSDVDMNVCSSLPGDVQPVPAKRKMPPKKVLARSKKVLEVEIIVPMSPRKSSRTPVPNAGESRLREKTPSKSPGLRKAPSATGDPETKTPTKSVSRTTARLAMAVPSDFSCASPPSSVLSEVTSRSASGEVHKATGLPVTDEQLDQLQDLCKDVFVKYSDGPDIQQQGNNMSGSVTPKQAPTSLSSISKALGTRGTLTTPRSQRSADIFGDSSLRLSLPNSQPHGSHHDFISGPSPSKRASMMRTWSRRPTPNDDQTMRHQNALANAAGKRKVPGTPTAEESTRLNSPAKRPHLSPPAQPTSAILPTPKARTRPKPVFATSSPRTSQIDAIPLLPASPAQSILTNTGSAPTTPFKSGSGVFDQPNTAQGSPAQEYDTDKSYVSSSVIEEKMPMLIPYHRPKPTALSQEHFRMDIDNYQAPDVLELDTQKDVDMTDAADDSSDDLMAMFGDFEWTADVTKPVAKQTSMTPPSEVPAAKSINDADETLIDNDLQGSPSVNLSTDDVSRTITSPNSDLDVAADSTRTAKANNGVSGNQKALDMFAQLKAKHEQEEEEKRKKEEEARKKVLEEGSGDDDSDEDFTTLLDKLKKPTTAIKEEDAKGKGYGLRSSAEPSIQKPTARLAPVAYRASQLPAGFAKITRDLKKENNLRKSGMTALELAQMTLRQVEEDKQNAFDGDRDTTPSRLVVKSVNPAQEETDWSGTEPNESEGEGKGADAPLRKAKPKDPDAEDTKLANIPVWPGVWEDLKAESIAFQTPIPDVAKALPVFASFAKKPRPLMAVLPIIIGKAEAGNVPHYIIEITTTFPSHPVANTATRIFASLAPSVMEMSFWHAHLLRISGKYLNDSAVRAQATVHWLHCLLCVLKNPASLPSDQAVKLVVLLVKLFIDKRSDFAVRLAVLDCINESLKDLSEDQLVTIATTLAQFSEPYAARRLRQRIANAFSVTSPQARSLKILFALKCLDKSHSNVNDEKSIEITSLPTLVRHNSLSHLATTSDSPRGVLSAVRMLIQSLMHTRDVIEQVGNAGLRNKDALMSEAEARRSDSTIKRSVASKWRDDILDSLRWLKKGMINKGKFTSSFRHLASYEITVFLNRFEQSSRFHLDQFRLPVTQVAGASAFFKVKSERGTPFSGCSVTGENTRASSVLSDVGSTGGSVTAARPKPTRRGLKIE